MSSSNSLSMKIWNTISLFTVLIELSVSRDVTYKELQTLKADCHPYDTCNSTRLHTVERFKNCQCDEQCAHFGDCCLDAKKYSQMNKIQILEDTCYKVNDFEGYYVAAACKGGWRDVEIRRKCEKSSSIQDPLTSLPAISRSSGKIYKNFYCAVCNDDEASLEYWKLGILCPQLKNSTVNNIHENLIYNTRSRRWGVRLSNKFYQCDLIPTVPNDGKNLRFCYPNVKKNCAPNWNDEFIKEKCESYTAILHIPQTSTRYRNAHCAICNNVMLKTLNCNAFFHRERPSPLSFTSLFDISEPTSPRCGKDSVYDPVLKKCHMLTCGLPFLELRNGQCVPKRNK